jgi:hypothetical protein
LSVPETNLEKTRKFYSSNQFFYFCDVYLASEGFSADISELSDSQVVTTNRPEGKQQIEDESTCFLPILSSTDRESPPPTPPKRIYGIILL